MDTYKSMIFQALARIGLRGKGAALVQGAAGDSEREAKTEKTRTGSGKVTKIRRSVEGQPKGRRSARPGHYHFEVRHTSVPHPRYGDTVPHFRSYEVPIDCNCGQPVLAPRMPRATAQVDAAGRKQQGVVMTLDPGPKVSGLATAVGPVQCSAERKRGGRCENKTLHASGLCGSHREG